MDGQAEAITQIVTAKALEGDIIAIRLVLDRIVPVRRERPIFFELPPLNTADDAVEAMPFIIAGVYSEQGDFTNRVASIYRNFAGIC